MLTVTTEATDKTLLTLAELRAAVGLTDNSKDPELTALGNRAAAAIARACRVAAGGVAVPTLRKETLSETQELRGASEYLVLARRPIVSITSVTENATALAAADYRLLAPQGMLQRRSGNYAYQWTPGVDVVVVYSAGWSTVPDDLKLAATKFVRILFAEARRDASLKRVKIEGVSEREYWVGPSDDPLVPQEVMDLLGPYINLSVG